MFIQRRARLRGWIPEQEIRIEDFIPGVILVGHPDLIHPELHKVVEIKYTKLKKPPQEYRLQLSAYKYMLEELTNTSWETYFLFSAVPLTELKKQQLHIEVEKALQLIEQDTSNTLKVQELKYIKVLHYKYPIRNIKEILLKNARELKKYLDKGIAPRKPSKLCIILDCPLRTGCREYIEWSKRGEDMSKNVTFKIDYNLLEKLDKKAKEKGLTRSEAIREAIEKYLQDP